MAGTDHSAELITGGPVVILVEPQLGENIGTAARAMANFGLSELRLVKPRDGWPNHRATAAAAKANHVIDGAKVFDDLPSALTGLHQVYATTARPRDLIMEVSEPQNAALEMQQFETAGQKCGIMFGREKWGLENDEIALADKIVTFPVNPAFASLNIAQSVLLMAYEWMRSGTDFKEQRFTAPDAEKATKDAMNGFFEHLESALDEVEFFRPAEKRASMIPKIRVMFQKAQFSGREVSILRGIIAALQGRKIRDTPRLRARLEKIKLDE